MTSSEIITAITIHLLVPAAGVVAYLALCRRLVVAGASPMFLAQLFLLFVCYGGAFLVVLTSLFWYWSGMASLGVFFLILAAPILLFPVLLSLWKQKSHHSHTAWLFELALDTTFLSPCCCARLH
jgi:hypothetical protein